ncbi:unnamed protein product [Cuscuta epithymum]|uniref:Uncharacterized protein n=1 Tax=Cuscuta epithymum TaxID=186058 RepID=A0AAV0G0W7_9ASTE|nr:unnamed protein product [Cuscuta epithymum]
MLSLPKGVTVNPWSAFSMTPRSSHDDDDDALALATFITPTFQYDLTTEKVHLVSIDDLMKMEEDGKHWVYREILAKDSYMDWYYILLYLVRDVVERFHLKVTISGMVCATQHK